MLLLVFVLIPPDTVTLTKSVQILTTFIREREGEEEKAEQTYGSVHNANFMADKGSGDTNQPNTYQINN